MAIQQQNLIIKGIISNLIEKYDGNMFVRNYYENMLSNINV